MRRYIDKLFNIFHIKTMPAKNSIKLYAEDSYYHLYNRGVEKRPIFLDEQDQRVFLSYLRTYLLPKDEKSLRDSLSDPAKSSREKEKIFRELKLNNFYHDISLLAYCLMDNHIHLLVKQKSATAIDRFMNSLGIRYAMYFNKKYKRVGSLFQDVYKAVLIESDSQLLYLSGYIHRNPLKNIQKSKLASQVDVLCALVSKPSSYPEYLGKRQSAWVHPEDILAHFSETNPKISYHAFIEETDDLSLTEPILKIAVDLNI